MTKTERKPVKCPECGSTEIGGPDHEGNWDCYGCGIWFDPRHHNNTACFGDPADIIGKLLTRRIQ